MAETVPVLRFDLPEVAQALRLSRSEIYERIKSGALAVQKDGRRSYITRAELERYVASLSGEAA